MSNGGNLGAAAKACPAPAGIVLRLVFNYGIAGERSQRPMERVETVGLMIEGGRSDEEVDEAIGRVLLSFGAEIEGPTLNGKWASVDVGGKSRAAALVRMAPPGVEWTAMDSEEEACFAIAAKTHQIGRVIQEEALPVGWRRADDVEGAISTMGAMGLLFQELEALDEATQLGREVERAPVASPAARRPAL